MKKENRNHRKGTQTINLRTISQRIFLSHYFATIHNLESWATGIFQKKYRLSLIVSYIKTTMTDRKRILFVCLGNICRSPSAENVMRHLVDEANATDEIEIDSAGTADWHTGKAPDSRMTAAATKKGFAMKGQARQVKPADFETFDLILAMDQSNYDDLTEVRAGAANPKAKLRLFCDFCTEHDETEVPDPYYGGTEGFDYVIELLEDGCSHLLDQIRSGEFE